jgi:hypothetical protein
MDDADRREPKARPRGRLLWALALLLTLAALVYQRSVGPTRPVRGAVQVGGERISYKLKRSAGGTGAYDLSIRVPDETFGGVIRHSRYKTGEALQETSMANVESRRGGRELVGSIPRQPHGGKVVYSVVLRHDAESVAIPPGGPLVIRFRGHVPLLILVPHVSLMFLGMLWSNRTGMEALRRDGRTARLTQWSLVLLGVGGLLLGPLVQWHAFGEAWTGIPFGWDLTDNKTLIACAGWLAAFAAVRRAGASGRPDHARYWVLGAALLTLIIFCIPHSVMGTELDYATGQTTIVR